ncbi:MAG: ribbon-helix-helix protein, CopG family [Lachnospiraceae bacterium]|nr:ribbon-helix-helix protein, CopG family [Lachnospiraceae bacterium]
MKGRCRMKKKVTISLDEDIITRLKQLAEDSHRNVSQWITDKVIESDKEAEKQEKGK